MKLTRKEFEAQLALAKKLSGEARKMFLDNLKSAQVVDVDKDGNEVEIKVEVVEPDQPATDPPATDVAAIKAMVDQAIKDASAAMSKSPPATKDEIVVKGPAFNRAGRLKNFKGEVGGKSADERAYRFGCWALATISRQMPGRFNFQKAAEFADSYIGKLHQENVNSTGGVLVPTEFGTDLIDLREQYGVARRLLKVVPMTSDTRTDPRRIGGLTAYFVAEGAAGTESTKSWDNVTLTAKDLMVLSRITNQLNEDSVISIGDDLAGEISYAFANKEDDCAFNGDGTSTYGGIYGLRPKIAAVGTAGIASQGSSNTWSAIALSDFNNVIGKLPQYADTGNAVWVAHKAFWAGVMQKLMVAAGGVTSIEIQNGVPTPMFLGYPVIVSQVMPSTTATLTICALLGDFSLAASLGDRRQDAIMFSEHASVGSQSVFERNEIAVRGTERFDINVHSVGDSSTAGPVVALKTGS